MKTGNESKKAFQEKIIFTNGCFDILHRAHIELLEYCHSMGRVIVGLNSDKSVRELKGEDRPFNNQDDRKKILESLRSVDKVIIFDELTPYKLISTIVPDIIVKGGDYEVANVIGYDISEVRIFPFAENYSSTRLLSKLEKKK